MTKIELSDNDKYVIAEFVYSCLSDILIKGDALKLIDVLYAHGLLEHPNHWKKEVNEQADGIVKRLGDILEQAIPDEQGSKLMDEYYAGQLG